MLKTELLNALIVNKEDGTNQFNMTPDELITWLSEYKKTKKTDMNTKKEKVIKLKNEEIVVENTQCMALITTGERCTRKSGIDSLYCGTHVKITNKCDVDVKIPTELKVKMNEIVGELIDGIVCYIDNGGNIYDSYKILQNKELEKIGKYTIDGENKHIDYIN